MSVLFRNTPVLLAGQLPKRNRGTVFLDILGIRDSSYCASTWHMGSMDPGHFEEI